MARSSSTAVRYKPHPMLEMEARAKEKLEKESGRTFDAWVELAKKKGPKERKALSSWFRKEHGHSMMNAHWLSGAVVGGEDYGDPETLVDALYSGEKAALRPLHEAVVDVLLTLGDDVTVTSCKTMVPAYRKHVFAELAPVADGVRVQMSLGEEPFAGRLERSANRMPGERLTHSVTVRAKKDVDAALKRWLGQAYALGADKIARSTEFETPADFTKGVKASKTASATWASMTPAMQRDMVTWVTAAKQEDTRARRLATALEKLAAGEKRVY
jgi:hypothetical protein